VMCASAERLRVTAKKAIEERLMVRFATACRTTDALPTSGQTLTKAE
jgi:hypothetical protein